MVVVTPFELEDVTEEGVPTANPVCAEVNARPEFTARLTSVVLVPLAEPAPVANPVTAWVCVVVVTALVVALVQVEGVPRDNPV